MEKKKTFDNSYLFTVFSATFVVFYVRLEQGNTTVTRSLSRFKHTLEHALMHTHGHRHTNTHTLICINTH